MHIIDGKRLAEKQLEELKIKIEKLQRQPSLAVILVGDDKPSQLYVKIKERACKKVGIDFYKYLLHKNSTKQEIIDVIKFLNNDPDIDAILVQLPLPDSSMEDEVIQNIAPKKDADGFHPGNIRQFISGENNYSPVLIAGIMRLIKSTDERISGSSALIICNSEIFATPLKTMLERDHIKTTITSSHNPKIDVMTKQSDIIIIAIGQSKFLHAKKVNDKAIIIDVGINSENNNKITGDVDFESFIDTHVQITPVPGGVGPMTVAMLLENVYFLNINK